MFGCFKSSVRIPRLTSSSSSSLVRRFWFARLYGMASSIFTSSKIDIFIDTEPTAKGKTIILHSCACYMLSIQCLLQIQSVL